MTRITGHRSQAFVAVVCGVLASADPAAGQLLDRLKKAVDVAEKLAPAVVPIPTAQEIEIGRGIAATVAGHYGVERDPAITGYLNFVGAMVAGVEPRPGIAYRFAVLDTDEVNAFAAPGGFVFVTRGALALMTDEAMLAGVLAHEIGHIDERHIVEEIQNKVRVDLGVGEAADAVEIWGEDLLEEAVQVGTESLFMGLSREDELAADAFGVTRAARAGYAADGLPRFIAAMEAHAVRAELSLHDKTHPDAAERLELTRETIAERGLDPGRGVRASERYARHSAALASN